MKIVVKGHMVAYHFERHMQPGTLHWTFTTSHSGKLDSETVAVIPHEFEFDTPEINVIAAQVAGLEAGKLAALEEYQRTVAEINERLSKLLALEAA